MSTNILLFLDIYYLCINQNTFKYNDIHHEYMEIIVFGESNVYINNRMPKNGI